jgi:hypothetical protein
MLRRCYDPGHPEYARYGGRGIGVCVRWRHSYTAFLADMGEPPEGLVLDRLDDSQCFAPANCRWVARVTSSRPRRPTNPQSLRQQALRAGLPYPVVYQRIHRHFWPAEKALSTPLLARGRQPGWRKPH